MTGHRRLVLFKQTTRQDDGVACDFRPPPNAVDELGTQVMP
jgi:hypothetical protein